MRGECGPLQWYECGVWSESNLGSVFGLWSECASVHTSACGVSMSVDMWTVRPLKALGHAQRSMAIDDWAVLFRWSSIYVQKLRSRENSERSR